MPTGRYFTPPDGGTTDQSVDEHLISSLRNETSCSKHYTGTLQSLNASLPY